MHKILCTIGDAFAGEGKRILREIGHVDYRTLTQKQLETIVGKYTIIVTQFSLRFDKKVLDKAKNLRLIATATTGLDHIDDDYAKAKGIKIISLKGETVFLSSVTATAELALGLLIALVRKIPTAHASVTKEKWSREALRGSSLHGKTLGVVGYGRLGGMMARYGKALGMRVVFCDPEKKGTLPLARLLQTAECVSLHVPLSKKTEGLIGKKECSLMKPTAVLINTSRGKVVDEDALLVALKKNLLAGYATDVLADELTFDQHKVKSKLIDYAKTHDNVIITPHIGGTTREARTATDIFIAAKVRDALSRKE